MGWASGAPEAAMKKMEVILRAMSGQISWVAAAEILQASPRTVRRWRLGWQRWGYNALIDRRRQVPSPRRVAVEEVQRVVQLYREKYARFNVRHFHEIARASHGVTLSYSFTKKALQEAGLVKKYRARGRHRRRREPRACFGEMLHLDGSDHEWLELCAGERQTLMAVVDDATKRALYAQLWPSENLEAVMAALKEVFQRYGLPMALYTDRASWAAWTPKAGGKVDKDHLTEVGRALQRLGIEHILSYSPQARGRVERLNRTFQGRLVNELRVASIDTIEQANRYLREHFVPGYNRRFERAPKDPDSAFVALGRTDLEQFLCTQGERTVGRDNVVSFENVPLQLAKQRGRRSCAGLRVTVRRHLDGTLSVWRAATELGRFDAHGNSLIIPRARAMTPPRRGARLPLRARTVPTQIQSGQITCQT